ncbi:protein of unknown function DUF445 [Alkalidesulfovibrio alkalitolerans DSM 16529]|jgi:uncharacterized membrane protein YheB (UPF0754 family)|uniref:DUF445 domain-containing protein n=1 Tax=Alkalidesulfovibrio alkalitolerans DSM 16529 TaxID=1121439 RepID=S7ULV6_9BACT|nr:DUF445 family protein [Alkalidesulfovibrio alkalitolerans]EPR34884.1 protein of unknown function DUF445 [Alkalidesulfovibrio alkalitolerans DSM 16529]
MDFAQFAPYLLTPFVCALIGWATNWIAVKMLFHPREPWKFGPLAIQGIFPKRQKALAARLGEMVQRELVNMEEIAEALRGHDMSERFREVIDAEIGRLLTEKLVEAIPMAAMFLSESMIEKLKKLLVPEILKLVPTLVDKAAGELSACYDIEAAVRAKVEAFPVEKLEEILFSIMRREFRFVEITGGVLGFMIGSAQSLLFWLLL